MLNKNTIAENTQGSDAIAIQESAVKNWVEVKTLLHKEFGDTAFKNWIVPIQLKSFNSGILYLSIKYNKNFPSGASNIFASYLDWQDEHVE